MSHVTRKRVKPPKVKKPRRVKPLKTKKIVVKRTILRTRHKERTLLLPGWRNAAGMGEGLVVRPLGVIPSQDVLKTETIDYTYDGNKRHFNVCDHDRSYLGTSGLHHPLSVTRYKSRNYGWPATVPWYQWSQTPPTVMEGPPQEVLFRPTLPVLNREDNGYVDKEFEAYMKLRYLAVDKFMNLYQSIWELKDTPDTAEGLLRLSRFMVSAVKAGRLQIGATMMEAAKAYLTYQFGIAPTVSDIRKFADQCSRQKLRVLQVPTRYEKGEVIRARWKIRESDSNLTQLCGFPPMAETRVDGWVGHNGVFYTRDSSVKTRPWIPSDNRLRNVRCYEYTGWVFGRLKKSIDISSVDKKLRVWSWNCPAAATLWAITPMTFLLDWIVDIGSVIERLDRYSMAIGKEPEFETGVWRSVRREAIVRQPSVICRSEVYGTTGRVYPGDYPIWNYTCINSAFVSRWNHTERIVEYDRGVYVPSASVWLPPVRWNLNAFQLSTGAALIMNLSKTVKSFLYGLNRFDP